MSGPDGTGRFHDIGRSGSGRGVHRAQLAVCVAVLIGALAMAIGAVQMPRETGYSGVGPAFVPGLTAAALAVCGLLLGRQALSGGFATQPETATPDGGPRWGAFVLASAGLLLDAALITTIGFTLAGTLLFSLVATALGGRRLIANALVGFVITWLVFAMFNMGLGLNLPALLASGWL